MSLPDTALEDEIRRLEELRTRNPRGHTFARLADLYRRTGLPEKGLEVVREGLPHHARYLNAHLIHGRILCDLGRDREAAAAFRRVLDIDEENLVALEALAALEPGPPGAPVSADRAPRPPVVASSDASRAVSDARAEPSSWLAQLEAEWREKREPESGHEAGEHSVPDSGPSEPSTEPTPADEVGPDRAASSPQPEVATATLAELYLRQGLYEEAISVYEKLLARDPYSARLAASLDEARRLSREGPRRGAPRAPPARPPGPELPHPEPASRPVTVDESVELTIRERLTAILEGRARVGTNPESAALNRLRRWLTEAATTGDE